MLRRLLVLALVAETTVTACAHGPRGTSQGTLRIYLARHGQTEWNAKQRIQGGTDVPLNDTGRRQAQDLAARLQAVDFDGIYSSALRRSRETAEIVAGGRPVESLQQLNEQSCGGFEGKYLDGRDSVLVKEFARRSADAEDTMDGGESVNQHFARVKKALETIRSRHPSGQILIVGHGGTNAQILRALLHLSAEQAHGIHQANTELYLIELSPGRDPMLWKLIPPANLNEL